MIVPKGYLYKADLLKFAQKTKPRLTDLIENEITSLESVETQFGLIVKFSIIRNNRWNTISNRMSLSFLT